MSRFVLLRNKCIRRFAQIFSLTTIGFVFQACYGPIRERHYNEREIYIRLFDQDNQPLEGIEVIVNDSTQHWTTTSGYILSYPPLNEECKIHIVGNDLYQPFDTIIPAEELYVSFDLVLQKK